MSGEQAGLFDLAEGRRRRDEALEGHEKSEPTWLDRARVIGRTLARAQGTVTADDIRAVMSDEPHHPNVWGAIFKGSEWEPTGQFVPSKKASRKANPQRVWRLKE